MIWGFAPVSISTNMAKDLGCRLVATIFFGAEAWTFRTYWWISLFVNIPATLFATAYYEMVLKDTLDAIGLGHAVHEEGEDGLAIHLSKAGMMQPVQMSGALRGVEAGREENETFYRAK
jgi:hypothetical protein